MRKKNIQQGLFVLGVITAALSVSSCTVMQSISDGVRMFVGKKVVFVEPPESSELETVNALAISQVGGAGNGVAQVFEEVLHEFVSAKIGNASYYAEVVSGAVPANKASNGSWAQVEVSLGQANVDENNTREERFRCPKQGEKLITKCDSDEAIRYAVNCRSRIATVEGGLIAKKVLNGDILATRNAAKEAVSKVCDGDTGNLDSPETLLSKAALEVAKALAGEFTPKVKNRPLDLIKKDKVLSEPDMAIFTYAYQLVTEGMLDEAKEQYQVLLSNNLGHGGILFNLGYCEHALGNYAEAHNWYKQAAAAAVPPTGVLQKYSPEVDAWLNKGVTQVKKKNRGV